MNPAQSSMNRGNLPEVAPLTCTYMDGRPYQRRADVEAQIRLALKADPGTWPALAAAPNASEDRLSSEAIVHLIRVLRKHHEQTIAGRLIEQFVKRMETISQSWARGFDQTTTEEIIINVGRKVITLVLAETPSAASTLNLGVGNPREFRDTPRHKEVSHEQEVYRPTVG